MPVVAVGEGDADGAVALLDALDRRLERDRRAARGRVLLQQIAEMRAHDPHRRRCTGLVGLGQRLLVQDGARGIPCADDAPARAGGHDRIGEPDAVERPQRVLQQRDAGAQTVLPPGRLDDADLGARSRQAVREREPPDAAAGDDDPHARLLMPSVNERLGRGAPAGSIPRSRRIS